MRTVVSTSPGCVESSANAGSEDEGFGSTGKARRKWMSLFGPRRSLEFARRQYCAVGLFLQRQKNSAAVLDRDLRRLEHFLHGHIQVQRGRAVQRQLLTKTI